MAGGTFVYVSNANSREVGVYQLDASGGLKEVQRAAVPTPGGLGPLAVSPDRRFLYTAQREDPFPLNTFAIDGLTGELTHIATSHLAGSSPYIITDRTGRWLFSASYQHSLVSVSPIGPSGVVQPPHQIVRTEQNAHSIQ